jgi:hypothetical protein
LLEHRPRFVVEGGVEAAFFQQVLHFLVRACGADHPATSQLRQLAGHVTHGTGGT